MDLYEEKPVLELSGGADGSRLFWVPVLYFASWVCNYRRGEGNTLLPSAWLPRGVARRQLGLFLLSLFQTSRKHRAWRQWSCTHLLSLACSPPAQSRSNAGTTLQLPLHSLNSWCSEHGVYHSRVCSYLLRAVQGILRVFTTGKYACLLKFNTMHWRCMHLDLGGFALKTNEQNKTAIGRAFLLISVKSYFRKLSLGENITDRSKVNKV